MWLWNNRRDFGLAVLSCLAIASLVSAIALAFRDKIAPAGLCGALGLLLLAFVQLSRFKKVRGIGFEAELWEDKQREAEELLGQTRQLLAILSTCALEAAARMGRWDSYYRPRELAQLGADVEKLLKAARIPVGEIRQLRQQLDRTIAFDMAVPIREAVHAATREKVQKIRATPPHHGRPLTQAEAQENIDALKPAIETEAMVSSLLKLPKDDLESWPDTIRRTVRKIPVLAQEETDALLDEIEPMCRDLEAWAKDRTIRRPEFLLSLEEQKR